MKKLTLLAAMAVCGMGAANAQLVDPSLSKTNGDIYDVVKLDVASVESLKEAGKTVNEWYMGTDARPMDVWAAGETLEGGSGAGLGVDGQGEGFISFVVVAPDSWAGGGVRYAEGEGEVNTAHFSDNTRFHLAIKSNNAPNVMQINVLDGFNNDETSEKGLYKKAALTLGDAPFEAGSAIVGKIDPDGDWKAIDLSFSEIKKLYPAFEYAKGSFYGYIFSFNIGNEPGKEFDIDAVYFYSPKAEDGAVESVKADNVDILVSSRTINATVAGFELYNIAGQLVKSTKSTVMGVEDLNAGLYVVKAGNTVKKVVIR